MTSQDCTDEHRMSTDVNNKTGFTAINNNPSSSPSAADSSPISPMMRDQSAAAVTNRRSDVFDNRSGGCGSGPCLVRSPKLECRGASGGGKKAQKTSHHSSAAASATGKWRQKMSDGSTSAAGGRSQASDSVRICF